MVRLRILVLTAGAYAVAFAALDVDALIRQVSTYDWGQDPSALRQLEAESLRVAGTPNSAPLEKRLVAALSSAQTQAARDAYCRDLSVLGTSASVPALAPMLLKADTAEMARYALERIPGQAATDALRKALPQAPPSAKTGIVNSLGRRRDAASVPAIKPLLTASDPRLVEASATALSHIGTPDARHALISSTVSPAVADALLMVASNEKGPAADQIYKKLQTSDNEAVRMAVLRGMARADGAKAVPALEAALKSNSPRLRGVAVRELAVLDRSALMRQTDVAPVEVLTALADSGQADVVTVLEQHLTAEAAPVRVAALNGLAKVGTAKDIPLVAAKAAETAGPEQAAARSALASIRGAGADAAVLNAIPSAAPGVKVELIRAAGERGIRSASDTLLKTATDPNKAVRAESIRALRETAGPEQVPALVALLMKTQDDNERKEYERAVAFAIRRSKEARVTDVVQAYESVSDSDVKTSLLGVMSAVGSSDALPVVRQALKSNDADVQRAAINALASWPSVDPADDLLTIAQTSTNPSQQVLALRGYVKLVQIPSNRPPAETSKLLARAMAAAKRPDEKKLVIAAAQRVITPESLELVKKSADDPAVAAEAKRAQTALERGLTFRRN